jgi:molybdate transport system substrate-binding protein
MLRHIAITVAVTALLLSACSDDAPANDGAISGGITVFAAASLTEAFEEIGAAFEDANPNVSVEFNFAGSQELRTQLEQGAPADVFASANHVQMDLAVEAGEIAGEPRTFAHNYLVVIVPKSNEAGIETLHDLANPGVKVVLAQPQVPAGAYARELLDAASASPDYVTDFAERVLDNVVSEEPNVRQIVAKVQLDEADAGIVYTTDVTPEVAADLNVIEIPSELNLPASYPIAITDGAGAPDIAQAFIDYVLSDDGQAILSAHGFLVANP